jgi:hypothetical protein
MDVKLFFREPLVTDLIQSLESEDLPCLGGCRRFHAKLGGDTPDLGRYFPQSILFAVYLL